jgi:hypothetical protein
VKVRPPRAALGLTIAALALIAAETLIPHPERAALVAETPVWCLVCGDLGVLDVLLNIGLFVPFGAGLGLLGKSWRQAMILGAVLSFAIELAQYFAIAGRDASLSDLITNTGGTLLGALAAGSWRSWLLPDRRTGRLLAAASALAWLTQVAITGAAVQPTLPATVYWGQRAADLAQFDTFPGKLLDARVGAGSLPSYRLPNSDEVRRQLLAGAALTAVVEPDGPTQGIAPLASIFDDGQREIAVLGQWNEDLVFRLRARAIDLRLRPPAVRLPMVFRNAAGETLTVAGGIRGKRFVIEAAGPDGRASRVLPLSAQWGWSLLLPFDYAFGPEVGWLSALWVGCWLLPIGFWLRGSCIEPAPAAALTVVLLGLGLAGIPALFQAPGSLLEWAAGLAGAASGWGLAGVTRRRRMPARAAEAA